MKIKVKDEDALRKLALKVGGSVRADGRVFNASGQKVETLPRAKRPEAQPAPSAPEPSTAVLEMLQTLRESFVALTEIMQTQSQEIATLRDLVNRDRSTEKPKKGPVLFDVVRDKDGNIVRMIAKPMNADVAPDAGAVRSTH